MENAGYLYAAFGIIWAGVFGYVLSLVLKQRRLHRELEALKESLGDKTEQ